MLIGSLLIIRSIGYPYKSDTMQQRAALIRVYIFLCEAESKNSPSAGQPKVSRGQPVYITADGSTVMMDEATSQEPSPHSPIIIANPPSNPKHPLNKPFCGDITTVADSWWWAPGAPCVSMCPPPPSNCQPVNSSFTRTQTRIKPSLTASVLQKYFLKNNTVYSLAFNFQASVNLVMSRHRTEEQLINVKPSVCHHT